VGAEQAARFAARIDALAAPSRTAGSELLQCTTGEEIPVKLSRGEYTEDFLMNDIQRGNAQPGRIV
jgi:hypothetical protein